MSNFDNCINNINNKLSNINLNFDFKSNKNDKVVSKYFNEKDKYNYLSNISNQIEKIYNKKQKKCFKTHECGFCPCKNELKILKSCFADINKIILEIDEKHQEQMKFLEDDLNNKTFTLKQLIKIYYLNSEANTFGSLQIMEGTNLNIQNIIKARLKDSQLIKQIDIKKELKLLMKNKPSETIDKLQTSKIQKDLIREILIIISDDYHFAH